jgi:hypothetical protein
MREAIVLYLANSPHPPCILSIRSPLSSPPNSSPRISLCNNDVKPFQDSVNAPVWHPKFRKHDSRSFFFKTQLSNIPASLESYREVALRYLTLTWCPWTSPDLPRRVLEYFSVVLPNSGLQATDTFHEFFLFNFAFSTNIKPSPVSTDHCVCFYIKWTDILHHEMVLLSKDVSNGLLTIEFSSIHEPSLVPDSFSECNSNGCHTAARNQRILFQKAMGI